MQPSFYFILAKAIGSTGVGGLIINQLLRNRDLVPLHRRFPWIMSGEQRGGAPASRGRRTGLPVRAGDRHIPAADHQLAAGDARTKLIFPVSSEPAEQPL